MTDRTDYIQSSSIRKPSRRRHSRIRHHHHHHHHNSSSSKSRVKNVIHTSIRSKSNTKTNQRDNAHSILTTDDIRHHRHHSRKKSISKKSTARSKSKNRSSISHSSRNAWETEDSQIETDRENSHRTLYKAKTASSKLSSSIYPTIIDLKPNRLDTVNNHHKNVKNKKKRKHLCLCVILSILVAAFVLSAIATAIPLALLSKSQTTNITTTATPYSTPIQNPCLGNIFWNTTSITYAGGVSTGTALNLLNSPTGIFMDSHDNLYISDSGNFRVVKYTRGATSGILVAGTGTSGTGLNQLGTAIRFIYVDLNQNIYVSDNGNHRVMRWANGASTGSIVAGNGTAGNSSNQLYNPYSVWVDSNSNLFVAEYQNNRVTKWSSGATSGIIVAGGNGGGITPDKLSAPSGLAYDETNQDLYIVNVNSNSVIKWHVGASNGTVVGGTPGPAGSSSTQLSWPLGIKLDQWNNIYIADRSNNRIQLFCHGNLTGITIAGASIGGSSLVLPYSVAFDSQLNLYVSDIGVARVYKFIKL